MRRKLIDKEKVRKLVLEGLSDAIIATRLGVGCGSVGDVRREFNLQFNSEYVLYPKDMRHVPEPKGWIKDYWRRS